MPSQAGSVPLAGTHCQYCMGGRGRGWRGGEWRARAFGEGTFWGLSGWQSERSHWQRAFPGKWRCPQKGKILQVPRCPRWQAVRQGWQADSASWVKVLSHWIRLWNLRMRRESRSRGQRVARVSLHWRKRGMSVVTIMVPR